MQHIYTFPFIQQLTHIPYKSRLFGSSITDTHLGITPHDYDLVIDCPDWYLDSLMPLNTTATSLGGKRFIDNDIQLDIFCLKNAKTLQVSCLPISFDNLFLPTPFNSQMCMFDIQENRLITTPQWIEFMETRVLRLNSRCLMTPEKIQKLITKFKNRYNCSFSS